MNESYPQSAPHLSAADIAEVGRIDRMFVDLAMEMGALEMQYPTLISRAALEKAEYPKAFPHLLMVATNLQQPALNGDELLDSPNLVSPQWCLSPAVCYHAYSSLANQRIDGPLVLTACGRCFRNEAFFEVGRRQIEFTMREIILIGTAESVRSIAATGQLRLEQIARMAGLFGDWQVAEDPFFLPSAAGKALIQRMMLTKLEYCVDRDGPLAVASVNRHGEFFGRRFNIRDAAGEFVHTACIAAGLDRWLSCAGSVHEEVVQCCR